MNEEIMRKNTKYIRLNDQNVNIKRLTAAQIKDFIENYHPEDMEDFGKEVFKNGPVYNHFVAQRIFLKKYFPETLEKKEPKKEDDSVAVFRQWASIASD